MNAICKRTLDILLSGLGLIILSPLLIAVSIAILVNGRGNVFFVQKRVGYCNADFKLIKFRTMKVHAEKDGLITIGSRDPRITRLGLILRKYRIDELPQLVNVLFGQMSLVGPRPEVRKYVDNYTDEQKKVLTVRPGITSLAAIQFANENAMLEGLPNPEKIYVEEILPKKLAVNIQYMGRSNCLTDLAVIFKTFRQLFYRNTGRE
jgi:lipopolysaccharide/colanic/teichoic acid biosynthesis glycosyltransferase